MPSARLYVGFDEREEVGSHVFTSSLLHYSSIPVSLAHLTRKAVTQSTGQKIGEGTNAFTLSRFLIPFFEGWNGMAIFMDGADMMLRADLKELVSLYDPWKAVQVVKHDYKTRHPRKYVGTAMEAENKDYDRKQWASVMLINCSHFAWRRITPETVSKASKIDLLQFKFLEDSVIGELPKEWNWLADEHGPNPEAKLIHWTAGVPGFPKYRNTPHAEEWFEQLKRANYATH